MPDSLQFLSPQFIAQPTDKSFVPALAAVLTHLIKLTSTSLQVNNKLTRFHGVYSPKISVDDYLTRIAKYFRCSNECFVLSLIYIDRIVKLHDGFVVNCLNIHRLLITSVMLAAKFFDDVYFSNSFYARVGGVDTLEINLLEAHFLSLINYQLFVSPEEYDQYRYNVEEAVRPVSLIDSPNPSLYLYINSQANDNNNNSNNSDQHFFKSRSLLSSKALSPLISTKFKNFHKSASYHPSIMIPKQLPDLRNQVFRWKKEDEAMDPAFFNNNNYTQLNENSTYVYTNNNQYSNFENEGLQMQPNNSNYIMNNISNNNKFHDARSSQNGIEYR